MKNNTEINTDLNRVIKEELWQREFLGKNIVRDIELDVKSIPTETLIELYPQQEKLKLNISPVRVSNPNQQSSNIHLRLAEAERNLLVKRQGVNDKTTISDRNEEFWEETKLARELRIESVNERRMQREWREQQIKIMDKMPKPIIQQEISVVETRQDKYDQTLAKEIAQELHQRNKNTLTKEDISCLAEFDLWHPDERNSDKLMEEIVALRPLHINNPKFERPVTRLERQRVLNVTSSQILSEPTIVDSKNEHLALVDQLISKFR
jgi:hypothetical protein